jgi:hypothetical protein
MSSVGVIFKRCGCRGASWRRLEQSCPRLAERGHGSWYFPLLRHVPARRSGTGSLWRLSSQAAARRARDEWLAGTAADRTAQGWTLEWLRHWLDTRTKIRPTTRFHYTRDVENVLIPHLGRYRLEDLDAGLLRAVFTRIAATTNSKGRPQSAAAMQHLRTTLGGRSQPGCQARPDRVQPGPPHRDQRLPATPCEGVDRRPRGAMGADR